MMNELRGLWRGKRLDNGNWIEGDLIRLRSGSGRCNIKLSVPPKSRFESDVWEVDPSTLGECTGLRDKNGKLIFEGDIVAAYSDEMPKRVTGTVKYGRFKDVDSLDNYDYLGWYIEVRGKCVPILQPEADGIYIEVIGNVHDNPELLKGAADETQ